MATLTVSNRSELLTALSHSTGGDKIVLGAANYGSVTFSANYASEVTIRSATPLTATFSAVTFQNASNIKLDGIHVDAVGNGSPTKILVEVTNHSHHITIANSEINGTVDDNFDGWRGIEVNRLSSNVALNDNYIHDVYRGIIANNVSFIDIVENDLLRVGDDSMKFSGIKHALIKNNFSSGSYISGTHQDFMQFQGSISQDLEIRGNVLLPESRATVQGIFFGVEAKNVLVEQNLVHTGMRNAIHFTGGEDIVIRDNTVLSARGRPAWIDVPTSVAVTGNIFSRRVDDGGVVRENLLIQSIDDAFPGYVTDYYVNGDRGLGLRLANLGIVKGSLGEVLGAADRIRELLGDTSGSPIPSGPPPSNAALLYKIAGSVGFDGTADSVISIAPDAKFEVSSATVAFSFLAGSLSGTQGLFSKDAFGYGGGGNHFSVQLNKDVLSVVFESSNGRKAFDIRGIQQDVAYDFHATFGDGKVFAWLNDTVVAYGNFTTNWTHNSQYLQIGAHNSSHPSGSAGFNHAFSGTISSLQIVEGLITPEQLGLLLPTSGPGGSDMVFAQIDPMEFNGRLSDTVIVDHDEAMELAAGSIILSFSADTVNRWQGLIGKESAETNGDFSAWLANDVLQFRFEDDSGDTNFRVGKIQADETYTMLATFDGSAVSFWLNDRLIGTAATDADLTENVQLLHLGAFSRRAPDQGSLPENPFDGTISDVMIVDAVLTPDDLI